MGCAGVREEKRKEEGKKDGNPERLLNSGTNRVMPADGKPESLQQTAGETEG